MTLPPNPRLPAPVLALRALRDLLRVVIPGLVERCDFELVSSRPEGFRLRGLTLVPSGVRARVTVQDGMELAGLEPATSWVRSRRSPN